MATLADFNGGDAANDMQDFAHGADNKQLVSDATANNVAANVSVLTPPASIPNSFNQIMQDLRYGDSYTAKTILSGFDNDNQSKQQATLLDMASDPNIPLEDRQTYLQNSGKTNTDTQSFNSRVAQTSLIDNSSSDDNDETNNGRIDYSRVLDQVDTYNGWVQQQLNTANNAASPDLFGTLHDIAETLVPFYQQARGGRVAIDLGGDAGSVVRALTAMGSSADTVRQMINSMPIQQRYDLAQKVVGLVNNSVGPTANDPNHLIQMELLSGFLQNGTQGDETRFNETLASVMDDTVLAGPISRVLGGVGKALRGSTAAVDEATKARYLAAIKEMGTPQAVDDVNNIAQTAIPKPDVNQVADNIRAFDNASSDTIAADKAVLANHFANPNANLDETIDNMASLDNAPKADIDQARQVISQAQATGNVSITPEAIEGTKQLISDHIINKLDSLDNAPYETYEAIRRSVSDAVDATGVGSSDVGRQVVSNVNDVLRQRQLGEIESRTAGQFKSYVTQATQESNIRRRMVRTGVQPTSVSQVWKDTNPARARLADDAVTADTTGDMAQKMYGTDRTDALTNDILPEVQTEAGSVRNKVAIDEAAPNPNTQLINAITQSDVANAWTQSEKATMRSQAQDDWRDVQGLYPRQEMSHVGDSPRGVNFSMVYGPKDGGFVDPVQAASQATAGLAKYGVTPDDIEVLERQPTGEYLPTTDFSKPGNYLVRVNKDWEFSPADTISWSTLGTNKFLRMFDTRLWFGRTVTAGHSGGLAQHIIPSTSVIDKVYLDSATRAADRGSWLNQRLLGIANEYADKFRGLDKTQQALVDDYIVRANAKSLKFDSNAMRAAGMSDEAVETVRSWKETWDTVWSLENRDLNKTMNARGYMRYIDNELHDDIIAKPLPIQQTGGITKAYDGSNGIKNLTRDDIRQIYERGGTIAQTRGAVEYGDDAFNHIVVDNRSATSYLRKIDKDDPTLAYRDGYYQIHYTDPYFITKTVKTTDGAYTKAIATAADRQSADAMLARLKATNNEGIYGLRGDLKQGSDARSDSEWEAMVSNGRTAQRVRGKQLGRAGETTDDINTVNVQSPEESLINSIRSVATRTTHRDVIDTAKARWMANFGDTIQPQNGVKYFPDDVRTIGANNLALDKGHMADAVNTWRYIDAMDSGYVNLIDDMSKQFFKNFSDTVGRQGWGYLEKVPAAQKAALSASKVVEKGLRNVSKVNPTGYARKKAFRLLLAFNPFRQAPVQAMQALPVILATNPIGIPAIASRYALMNYIVRGGDVDSFFKSMAQTFTGLTRDQAATMVKYYEQSGFEGIAKANSYIRDDMKSMVDRTIGQKVRSTLAIPGNIGQSYGFEAGENALMKTVWLSEYDKLLRTNNVTDEAVDAMGAKVRHLTGNMNKAGELPYNNNSLGMLMQFFQMPHKMFAQVVFGHKGLTLGERLRLGSAYVLTYGIGANYLTDKLGEMLPQNSPVNDIVQGGVFSQLFNRTLSKLYGQDVNSDVSDSFRVLQFPNFVQFASDVWQMQVGEILSNSPSASLVFGNDPRVTNFVQSFARPFTVNNARTPEDFINVGKNFLSMFSGASNFFKGMYILEHQKAMSSSGAITDFNANYVEGLLQMAGFQTMDQVKQYAINEKTYQASKQYKDDISQVIDNTNHQLATEGIDNNSAEYFIDQMAEAQRVFKNNPFYLKEFKSQITQKMMAGQDTLFTHLMKLGGFVSPQQMEDILQSAPSNLTADQIKAIRTFVNIANGDD